MKINLIFLILIFADSVSVNKTTEVLLNKSKSCSSFYDMIKRQQISDLAIGDFDEDFYGFPFYTSSFEDDSVFSKIFKATDLYLCCFKQILNDEDLHFRYKHIALFAMQKGDLETYIKVLQITFDAYKIGLIHRYTLDLSVVQEQEWSKTVLQNVNNIKLKQLLQDIKVYEQTPKETVDYIDWLFSKK